ncbi:sigma-70 family RNA polymerase sigma factor [soil metagenome]
MLYNLKLDLQAFFQLSVIFKLIKMNKELPNIQKEETIWLNFKNGSEKAFKILFDKYFSCLYSYGLQISTHKALVKDCIQNLFVELWKNKANLTEVKCVKKYLYISLRRKIIKELIRENKFKVDQLSENYDFEVTFPHEILLINDQSELEIQEKLLKSFENLSKRQKEAIYLRFYENMEYEDIAIVLSLKNVKYARTLIYRAIEVLKFNISKEEIF